MYLNTTVKIPEQKGKIIAKRRDTTYILYQYGSDYKQDRKYAIPLRAIVGKVSPEDPGSMYPNENFNSIFQILKYRMNCHSPIGAVVSKSALALSSARSSMNMTFGRCSKRFGKETGLILDLAAYLIVDEENVGQYYPDFAFRTRSSQRK